MIGKYREDITENTFSPMTLEWSWNLRYEETRNILRKVKEEKMKKKEKKVTFHSMPKWI